MNFALWRQYYIVNSNGQAQVSVLSLISTMNQNWTFYLLDPLRNLSGSDLSWIIQKYFLTWIKLSGGGCHWTLKFIYKFIFLTEREREMFILPWHLALGVDVGDGDGDIMEERLRIISIQLNQAIEKVGNVKQGESLFYILLPEKDKYDPPSEYLRTHTWRHSDKVIIYKPKWEIACL